MTGKGRHTTSHLEMFPLAYGEWRERRHRRYPRHA